MGGAGKGSLALPMLYLLYSQNQDFSGHGWYLGTLFKHESVPYICPLALKPSYNDNTIPHYKTMLLQTSDLGKY